VDHAGIGGIAGGSLKFKNPDDHILCEMPVAAAGTVDKWYCLK
jgi:hypothetical protein